MLRSQLGTHGVIRADNDVNQHFAKNITPDYSVKNSILLAKEELSRKVLEDVVLTTYDEMEMAKEKGMRDGKGHALLLSTRVVGATVVAKEEAETDAAGATE